MLVANELTVKMREGIGVSRVGLIMDSRPGRWPSREPTKNSLGREHGDTSGGGTDAVQVPATATASASRPKTLTVTRVSWRGRVYLDEVKREPFTEPKQERPTKTGMIQDMGPRWLLPKSCVGTQHVNNAAPEAESRAPPPQTTSTPK